MEVVLNLRLSILCFELYTHVCVCIASDPKNLIWKSKIFKYDSCGISRVEQEVEERDWIRRIAGVYICVS